MAELLFVANCGDEERGVTEVYVANNLAIHVARRAGEVWVTGRCQAKFDAVQFVGRPPGFEAQRYEEVELRGGQKAHGERTRLLDEVVGVVGFPEDDGKARLFRHNRRAKDGDANLGIDGRPAMAANGAQRLPSWLGKVP